MQPDSELLRQFAKTNSQDAFAELVKRHLNLVYSAALRQVSGDEHFAKDVAQTVFTDLARKADSLSRRETLSGWLYTSAHFAAAKIVRGENRRRDHEEKFMREPTHENAPETDWEKLRPTLDDAMHGLKESDREAVLLRYFENRQFAEVGAKLGLNENAARMRVERALEKLRDIFTKRGVTTATALASVVSANAIQIAPANLAATLTTASIATAGTGTFTLLKIMTATKLKLGISALVVASATTALVVQHQAQIKLRAENQSLMQQIAQLKTDNENLSNLAAQTKSSQSLPNGQFNELLKLRGEVTRLQDDANNPTEVAAKEWLAKVNKLKRRLAETPDANIPEFQFLTEQDWLNAASGKLNTDTDYRLALASLWNAGQNKFGNMIFGALQKYSQANNNQFPTDLSELKPYFDSPVDDAMLNRWEIVPAQNYNAEGLGGDSTITEKTAVDDIYDSRVTIGLQGYGSSSDFLSFEIKNTLGSVFKAFSAANNGQRYTDFSQLLPYATTSDQQVLLQKLIERDAAKKQSAN
jgi:RNA polymerase sigma factor (sigma-70 family)